MSTLYIESLEADGNYIQRICQFVRRELKILGGLRILPGVRRPELDALLQLGPDQCFIQITEIMIGIIQLVFGLPLNFDEHYIFAVLIGIPWWTGIWYIIAGSLVVDIINTSNTHLKQVILLMHLISIFAAVTGGGAYGVSLYLMPPATSNFFILAPLLLLFFLMLLCILEFVIAGLVLFLHFTLVVKEFHVSSYKSHSISQHLRALKESGHTHFTSSS